MLLLGHIARRLRFRLALLGFFQFLHCLLLALTGLDQLLIGFFSHFKRGHQRLGIRRASEVIKRAATNRGNQQADGDRHQRGSFFLADLLGQMCGFGCFFLELFLVLPELFFLLFQLDLEIGFALGEFGFEFDLFSGILFGTRLGFGIALCLVLGGAFLVVGFALFKLRFELGFLFGELCFYFCLTASRLFELALLLLGCLGAFGRRLFAGNAPQLGALALGERGIDAFRELLDVEIEVVGVVAVLDRAPEFELDLLRA